MSDIGPIRPTAPGIPAQGPDMVGHLKGTADVSGARLGEANLEDLKKALLGLNQDKGEYKITIDKPGDKQTPGDQLAPKLNDILNSEAFDIYTVMALFQKMAQQARTAAQQERFAELQNKMQALSDAAQKMRDAATKRFIGAIIQGSVQIASGFIQMGTSFASAFFAYKAGSLQPAAMKGDQGAVAAINRYNLIGQTIQTVGAGSGQILSAGGTFASGGLEYSAALDDAEKAEAEKRAQLAGHKYDQANEMMQQMREVIKTLQEKFAAIEQSRHETAKSIMRA